MSISKKNADSLRATVQHNCNVADARHASDYSLCVYLMKMREYYRWEKGYDFNVKLPPARVGSWLDGREQLWEQLLRQESDYQPLRLDGQSHDPFDGPAINRSLSPHGYVYSGGLGARSAPHFFLAQLKEQKELRIQSQKHTVFVSGAEYARDLAAPPAMRVGNAIFIRHQSLQRMLWEKYCEWSWNKSHRSLAKAFSFYPCESDLQQALDAMTLVEADTALLHEIGEVESARKLGEDWRRMLAGLPRSRVEITLRAVKDLLADCMRTLPELISGQRIPSLHFHFATLSGMRKTLAPSLAQAAQRWRVSEDSAELLDVLRASAEHWQTVAQTALQCYRQAGTQAVKELAGPLEEKTF